MNQKIKPVLFYLISGILLFSIYGSLKLSLVDYQQKNICPKILEIPACYIVLLFFGLSLAVHLLQNKLKGKFWYYSFMAIPFLLALGGTITELSGTIVCPRTEGGTPMCYISLGICTSLILLKLIERTR